MFDIPAISSPYRVEDARPFTTYTGSIAALTAVGPGPFSPPGTIQTPEDGENNNYSCVAAPLISYLSHTVLICSTF